MSRGQSTGAFNTAKSEESTNFGNSQAAFGDTQTSIGDYKDDLAKFMSGNPYTKGGEYDQTINTGLANTSDAGANSLAGALQSQAKRTGQNSAADAATAAAGAQQNTRDLSTALASAQQGRINSEADYNKTGLQAATEPISAESSLYGTSGSQGDQELNTETSASQTPSFWDTLGGDLAGGLGQGLGGRLARKGN